MKGLTWADVEAHNAKVFAGRMKTESARPLPQFISASLAAAIEPDKAGRVKVAGGKTKRLKSNPGAFYGSENIQKTQNGLKLVFSGQIMGGKNNLIITRTGHRFPRKSWADWRDRQVASIKSQLPSGFQTIIEPVNVRLDYFAGDKRRRDMPAIIDSIWHVLEKAGVVADDTLLWVSESSRGFSRENPGATLFFGPHSA